MTCRPANKAKQEDVEEEAEGELSADESDSAGDDKPARDIKLRPRKRVSFNLNEAASAEEVSQVRASITPSDDMYHHIHLTPMLGL